MLDLLDRWLQRRSAAVSTGAAEAVIPKTESEGETVASDLAKTYEEHNSKTPHSNPADQCQCESCKAYRAEQK